MPEGLTDDQIQEMVRDSTERTVHDFRGVQAANRSTTGHVNRGQTGKLNADQINERYKMHAQRIELGFPNIKNIIDHWINKHGVIMSYDAEKEWAKTNRFKILQERDRMIEIGELKVFDLGEKDVTNLSTRMLFEASKVLDNITIKSKAIAKNIKWDFDPLKEIGLTLDEYVDLEPKERVKVDVKIQYLQNMNQTRYSAFLGMNAAHRELVKISSTHAANASKAAGNQVLNKNKRKAEAKTMVADAVKKAEHALSEDIMNLKVTDEMRTQSE